MNYQKIKLVGGAEVTVDMDAKRTKCRKCDVMIRWGVTSTGKNMPISENADGEYQSHFADCKYAREFRRGDLDREERYREEDENQKFLNNL